jgi:hypothetical protein
VVSKRELGTKISSSLFLFNRNKEERLDFLLEEEKYGDYNCIISKNKKQLLINTYKNDVTYKDIELANKWCNTIKRKKEDKVVFLNKRSFKEAKLETLKKNSITASYEFECPKSDYINKETNTCTVSPIEYAKQAGITQIAEILDTKYIFSELFKGDYICLIENKKKTLIIDRYNFNKSKNKNLFVEQAANWCNSKTNNKNYYKVAYFNKEKIEEDKITYLKAK